MSQPQSPVQRSQERHVPVMLGEVLRALEPEKGGIFVDGTFGAGGYTRGILGAAKAQVIAIDRDPSAIAGGQGLVAEFGSRLKLVQSTFAEMQSVITDLGIERVQGVVLDIGVSSMQIDEAARGFSFMKDGPLDMRMGQEGLSAKDVVNTLSADDLARIIFILGEEPRSRAIAKAIVKARTEAPLATTLDLVRAIEQATGPQRAQDRTHPATRTFQALRIHVNAELEELANALLAAEAVLDAGGRLVVVTFHSLEDRIVKRFFATRTGKLPQGSRHQPASVDATAPTFTQTERGAIAAGEAEARANPRARSAKLRFAIRTKAAPTPLAPQDFGLPRLERH